MRLYRQKRVITVITYKTLEKYCKPCPYSQIAQPTPRESATFSLISSDVVEG